MAKLDKLLGKAQEHLDEGEEVLDAVQGAYETKIGKNDTVRTGIFAATDRRLLFYAKKMTGFDLESFPYENISSFEMGKGMMGHKISFFASGNKVTMKWVKGDVPAFVETVRGHMGKQGQTNPVPTPDAAVPDAMEQIRKLGALRDDGILTEEEFQAKKVELLAKL